MFFSQHYYKLSNFQFRCIQINLILFNMLKLLKKFDSMFLSRCYYQTSFLLFQSCLNFICLGVLSQSSQ